MYTKLYNFSKSFTNNRDCTFQGGFYMQFFILTLIGNNSYMFLSKNIYLKKQTLNKIPSNTQNLRF